MDNKDLEQGNYKPEENLEKSAPADRSENGPFDESEIFGIRPYVDMGSIKIEPREGLQVRLDVDQQAKRIVAVSLDYEESTLQVQAFAAPKTSGLWHEARSELLKQLQAQNAKVLEREDDLGPEVIAQLTVKSDGGPKLANVRFVGVDGPRWMLRGVISGKAMREQNSADKMLQIFRSLVVVRGEAPMPPNELLPMKVPAAS